MAPGPALPWLEADKEDFRQSFDQIQALIAAGTLRKAVPVTHRRARVPFESAHLASALRHSLLLAEGYAINAYGLWGGGKGILGITPEWLFKLKADGSIATMALAGTRSNEPGNKSLLGDPKEVREHAIVIEGISAQLKPLANFQVGPVSELALNSLVHLHAEITAKPKQPVSYEQWVSALHPTPAIGAWPKKEGLEWLRGDDHSRSRLRHGAPFGFICPGIAESPCLVAIRGVEWTPDYVQITAGNGILVESLFEKEWVEVNAKIDSVQYGLRL